MENDVNDATWKPLDSCDGLPGRVEHWLAEPGSLTARVRARCEGNFRLNVLDERRERNVKVFEDVDASETFCRDITLRAMASYSASPAARRAIQKRPRM